MHNCQYKLNQVCKAIDKIQEQGGELTPEEQELLRVLREDKKEIEQHISNAILERLELIGDC
jgi:hypothetical protein